MRIVVDVGHRNNVNDYGAIGVGGVRESSLALSIAKVLEAELKKLGHNVLLTRNSESETIGIDQRPRKARDFKADWLISIHLNAFNNTSTGVEVCYKQNKEVAEKLSLLMSQKTGLRNRGAKIRTDLGVLNGFSKSLLLECGFITNPSDLKIIQGSSFNKAIAESVIEALKLGNVKVSPLYQEAKERFKFNQETMNYLETFAHKEALYEAFLNKKKVSKETENFILKYKYGQSILDKVYKE